MAYADISDVRIYDRELGPDDEVLDWVLTLLGQAEAMLSDEFDLDALVASGRLVQVVMVESEMVAAVTRNPNAYASESSGIGGLSDSHTFLPEVAKGLLEVTDKQRGKIRGTSAGSRTTRGGYSVPLWG